MSVYLIIQTNIKDQEAYNLLVDEALPIFGSCNAKILGADSNTSFLEKGNGSQYHRTLIVEFRSKDSLEAWYATVKQAGLVDRWRSSSDSYLGSYVHSVEQV